MKINDIHTKVGSGRTSPPAQTSIEIGGQGAARTRPPRTRRLKAMLGVGAALFASGAIASAAGTLTSKDSADKPIQIVDHHVAVTINNGFAQTEVVQSFSNPNDHELEAVYRFPLPQSRQRRRSRAPRCRPRLRRWAAPEASRHRRFTSSRSVSTSGSKTRSR